MTDLHTSWQRTWAGIGASGDGEPLYEQLVARYSEPHRQYHTLQHLGECIQWFESARELALHPAEVEAALWFHDAIYELQRHDNEEHSAVWARTSLLQAGVPQAVAARVEQLVLATKHSALPVLPDEQLLVDIDLAILGAAAPRFAEYERQIREEYSFVPEAQFRQRRLAILCSFFDRPHIYSTAHFRSTLEERARMNLRLAVDKVAA